MTRLRAGSRIFLFFASTSPIRIETLVLVACPLCETDSQPLFEKFAETIWSCPQCEHRFCFPANSQRDLSAHVREQYADDYFLGAPQGYSNYLEEEAIQRASARFYIQTIRKHMPTGNHFDVGAACGFFVDEFQRHGWQSSGIEPNSKMAAIGRQKFAAPIHVGNFETDVVEGPFDLISLIQILSHLFSPPAAIKKSCGLLNEGGYLLIESWDRSSLAAKIFGQNWHEYNPPNVLHWFTRKSLRSMAAAAGFELVAQGLPRKAISVGRGVAMLRHSTQQSRGGRWITSPLALVPASLKVPYFLGDAFWMLFRKI